MFADFKDLGRLGIVTDLKPHELPDEVVPNGKGLTIKNFAWSGGRNIVFRNGKTQRIPGDNPIFTDCPIVPQAVQFYPDPQSGKAYWIVAGPHKTSGDFVVYAWDGTDYVEILSTDMGDAYALNGWTLGTIAGVPYVNNGSDAPYVWLRTGSDLKASMEQISTWVAGLQAMYVRSYLNFYIMMDITESGGTRNPSRIMWSHPAAPYAVPESFDIDDANYLAGDYVIGDTADYLVDCLQLRGINVVYKRNETWAMRPVQGGQVFRFDRLFKEFGLLGPRLVASVYGTHHFCVTNTKDIILHDGNTHKSIVNTRNRKLIFDSIDEDNFLKAFVKPHHQEEEIWFCYPESGNEYCNKAAIWNYASGAWGFRDLNQATDIAFGVPDIDSSLVDDSWDADELTWDEESMKRWDEFISSLLLVKDLMATVDGMKVIDDGNSFSSTEYVSYVERTGIDLGEPNVRKEISAMWPKISGGPVTLYVGSSNFVEGPYTWKARTFDPNANHKASFRVNGRYLGLKVEGSEPFRLDDLRLDARMRGVR